MWGSGASCQDKVQQRRVSAFFEKHEDSPQVLIQAPKTFPPDTSTDQCTAFLDFFSSKINTIHQQLASSCTSSNNPTWMITTGQPLISSFSYFTPVSEHTISELIHRANTTTCQLDLLPTSLVKACLPSISPMIVINSSLTTGLTLISASPAKSEASMCRPVSEMDGGVDDRHCCVTHSRGVSKPSNS